MIWSVAYRSFYWRWEKKFFFHLFYYVWIFSHKFFFFSIFRHPQQPKNETRTCENDDTILNNNSKVPLCSISDVQLRFLEPKDLEEVSWIALFQSGNFANFALEILQVRTLCCDFFPIEYPYQW